MKFFYIYKLTNTINGKGYVGYTSDIKRRMRQHKDAAAKRKGQAIHAAIRKYGWESFVVEELYRSEDKQQTLDMEDHFINLHETKGVKGYNITRGGQHGPGPLSEEQLEALRQRMKDPEIRRKISDGLKRNQNCLGRHHVVSEAAREKMKISNRGKGGSDHQKEVARLAMLGNTHAAGHRHTEEWKQERSEYMKKRDHSYKVGRSHTPEHREKIRLSGIEAWKKRRVI